MIWTLLVLLLGIFAERKYHPRLYIKSGEQWVDYNTKKGVRHAKRLFEYPW